MISSAGPHHKYQLWDMGLRDWFLFQVRQMIWANPLIWQQGKQGPETGQEGIVNQEAGANIQSPGTHATLPP